MISFRVSSSAVAVRRDPAARPEKRSAITDRPIYSGRKSCPPLRYAVRLVDRKQGDISAIEQGEANAGVNSRSGANVEQIEVLRRRVAPRRLRLRQMTMWNSGTAALNARLDQPGGP